MDVHLVDGTYELFRHYFAVPRAPGANRQEVGATRVETCTLLRRPGGYAPGFSALETDALVVFPWDYEAVTEEGRFESGSYDIDPDTAGA